MALVGSYNNEKLRQRVCVMSDIIQFPQRENRKVKLEDIIQTIQQTVCTHVSVTENGDGLVRGCMDICDSIVLRPNINSFSILNQWIDFYKGKLGRDKLLSLVDALERENTYSHNIMKKVKTLVNTGESVFKFEAQFPPTIIRRTEKNIYYATSYVMAVGQLLSRCHALLPGVDIIVESMERCDRCSLRLLQNFVLMAKPYALCIRFYFKSKTNVTAPFSGTNIYKSNYEKARYKCFSKFLSVLSVAGCATDIDSGQAVKKILSQVDFLSSWDDLLTHHVVNENLGMVNSCMDLLYKSNYEKLYLALAYTNTNATALDAEARIELNKIHVFADVYNYLFDEALERIKIIEQDACSSEISYFNVISGLIFLKKHKKSDLATQEFERGLDYLQNIPVNSARYSIEYAFLRNAMNLAKLLIILKENKDNKKAIQMLVNDEHQILDALLEKFVSTSEQELGQKNIRLELLFIISTLIENIAQLYMFTDDHKSIIQLYESYEYILGVTSDRMGEREYGMSFQISFSHALLSIKIKVARSLAKLNRHQQAYDITKQLIQDAEQHDVTGDYRAYLLHAHALNCIQCGYHDESIESLIEMARLYLGYNQPCLMKTVLNSLKDYIEQNHAVAYHYLQKNDLLDERLSLPQEASRFANSAVDLENTLSGGLGQNLTKDTKYILKENKEFQIDNIRETYRVYGIWRQLHALG